MKIYSEELKKIKDICEINPKQEILDDNFIISFVGMAQISNDNQFDTSILKKYEDVKKGFSSFKDGDILFAKITPCMENGKGVLIENLYNGIGFGSTEFHVLRPNIEVVDRKYLYWFTMYKKFRLNCEKNMTGSAGQKRVPKNYIENYEIKLPKLIIQEKRAKILDTILRIKKEKLEQIEKLEELSKCLFEVEFLNKSYYKYPLCECTTFIDYRGRTPQISSEGTIQMINAKSVGKNNFKYIDEFVTEEIYNLCMTRGLGEAGDILFVTEGHTFGNVCIIPENLKKFALGQRVITIRGKKEQILNKYLCYYMQTEEFKKDINMYKTGGTAQGIRSKDLGKILIPIPELKLQNQFAERVKLIEKSKFLLLNFLKIQDLRIFKVEL